MPGAFSRDSKRQGLELKEFVCQEDEGGRTFPMGRITCVKTEARARRPAGCQRGLWHMAGAV